MAMSHQEKDSAAEWHRNVAARLAAMGATELSARPGPTVQRCGAAGAGPAALGSPLQEGCGLWERQEGCDGNEGLGHGALGQLGLLGRGKAEGVSVCQYLMEGDEEWGGGAQSGDKQQRAH